MNDVSFNPLLGRLTGGLGVFSADKRLSGNGGASRGPNGLGVMGGGEGTARQKQKYEVAHTPILVQPIGMYKYA
jgi:hypothetical protein